MKKTLVILFLLSVGFSYGQIPLTNKSKAKFYQIDSEKTFVHYNSNFLLTGESLKYKVYVLNAQSNQLSSLSKIAYIELIDKEKKTIFKQKVALTNGQGAGDFLLTSNITSGSYKLIAYTLWMKNQSQTSFFIEDISIINPFDSKLLSQTENNTVTKNTTSFKANKSFKKREKATIKISELFPNQQFAGNYSISVKKIDAVIKNNRTTSLDFSNKKIDFSKTVKINQTFYLPEARGSLLYGKIIGDDPKISTSNVKIGLSIIGKDNHSSIIETNDKGQFFFNIDPRFESENTLLQVLDPLKENYTLNRIDLTKNDYTNLAFNSVTSNRQLDKLIQERSIYNQIENAYLTEKADTIANIKRKLAAYKNIATEYKLDDYTRFTSMKETFVEIIQKAWVKTKRDNYTFFVSGNQQYTSYKLLPLILIDDIIIHDHNELGNMTTKNVKSIWVYNNVYHFGAKIYQGVIAVETFNGDYLNSISFYKNYKKSFNLATTLPQKKYYSPNYTSTDKQKRIPDYRTQLYWNPDVNTNSSEITFYTSDVTGFYEVNIEGFTNKGKAVSIKKIIEVN